MDLGRVAEELYGLAPEQFTATRNTRAKEARAAGDKEVAEGIARLPKPSTAAWVVNMLTRGHAEKLERMLDLGAALRQAQQDLDGDELRHLNRQRHDVLDTLLRTARASAEQTGHRVSESVAAEVEQTLQAALADAAAADAVSSGRLTRALSSTWMGTADVDGAVAVPSTVERRRARTRATESSTTRTGTARAAPRADRRARPDVAKALADANAADEACAVAEQQLASAERELADAEARREGLSRELDELRQRMKSVQQASADVDREVGTAERARDAANRSVTAARRAAARARTRTQRLS